ncbi:MAG: RluA family pseudouridine synthase [Chloroflexi bacterium]|nr:RluA family pseudouridine synthase [Chloroflexota bacterium]
MNTMELKVEEGGLRIDRYLSVKLPQFSRAHIQKLIEDGRVKVQGNDVRASFKPRAGDVVAISLPPPVPTYLQPLLLSLDIVYEDDDLLVINKPAGLTVHPGPGHAADTLVNAVLYHCPNLPGIKGAVRPGVVHRLDKDTSGLIIFARNDRALAHLQQQFKSRKVKKEYLALVRGALSPPRGTIQGPIGRDPVHRQRMAVVAGGREASTAYEAVRYLDNYTLALVRPETGRTHQIRVHLATAGHPVAGDAVYGGASPLVPRLFLHAAAVRFRLPSTGEIREFRAELPADLKAVLDRLSPPTRSQQG